MITPEKTKKSPTKRITLADIAQHCGVHKATVSRVLNGRLNGFPVAEDTIRRVKQAAEELDYNPNWMQRAIRTQRTHLIGLSFIHTNFRELTPEDMNEENLILGHIANIIISHPGFKDYDLVFHNRLESTDRPLKPSDFKTDLLDGMIYLTPTDDHREFLDMTSEDFPIILLGQLADAEETMPCIDIDNRKMGKLAVEHLIDIGRRKILMLTPEKSEQIICIQDRRQGYRDALTENNMQISDGLIHKVRCKKRTVAAFLGALKGLDEVDAIFCATDELAALCIEPLKTMGFRIPEDIALIGFGNSVISQHTSPKLSTIHRSLDQIFYTAIDTLLKILEKETPYEPGFHGIETELIIRESTMATKKA